MDAIKIAYGTGRLRDTKPIYDVVLDRYTPSAHRASIAMALVVKIRLYAS